MNKSVDDTGARGSNKAAWNHVLVRHLLSVAGRLHGKGTGVINSLLDQVAALKAQIYPHAKAWLTPELAMLAHDGPFLVRWQPSSLFRVSRLCKS